MRDSHWTQDMARTYRILSSYEQLRTRLRVVAVSTTKFDSGNDSRTVYQIRERNYKA